MTDELQPARFEPTDEGQRAFKPRLPWTWVVPIGLAIVCSIGFYPCLERSKAA